MAKTVFIIKTCLHTMCISYRYLGCQLI